MVNRTLKDSGVEWIGEFPENWGVTKLKRLISIKSGEYVSKKAYENEGKYPIIGSNGTIGRIDKYNVVNEVITTGRVGTIGTVKLVKDAWVTDNALIIKSKENSLNSYMYYLLPCLNFDLLSTGTAQPLITATKLKNQIVPKITINEQKKIISFLNEKVSHIDNILEDTKQSIKNLKAYKQSIITETLTKGLNSNVEMKDSGVEWIGEMPSHWRLNRLKRLFDIKKHIANKLGYNILSVTQKGLKIKDIKSNEGQLSSNYSKYQIVEEDDFVMNHMDLLTGWVDLSTFKGVTSPDYRVFKSKKRNFVDNLFYKYIFQLAYTNKIFYGLGQGVSNKGRWRLQTDKFLNFELPIPPLKEQFMIVKFLDEKNMHIDSLIEQKKQLITELEVYKKSIIYEYVTGKKEVE